MEARILNEFRAIVGASGLITERDQLSTYECDGLTMFRVVPLAVLRRADGPHWRREAGARLRARPH